MRPVSNSSGERRSWRTSPGDSLDLRDLLSDWRSFLCDWRSAHVDSSFRSITYFVGSPFPPRFNVVSTHLKEVSAGGITAKVAQSGITLSDEGVTLLRQHLEGLTEGNQASQRLARQCFLRFVAVTIYGSQGKTRMNS